MASTDYGKEFIIEGWLELAEENKNVNFIAINDGSIIHNIQVVVDVPVFGEEALKPITTGACVRVNGILVQSQGSGQPVEIQAKEIHVHGTCDTETYPLQK